MTSGRSRYGVLVILTVATPLTDSAPESIPPAPPSRVPALVRGALAGMVLAPAAAVALYLGGAGLQSLAASGEPLGAGSWAWLVLGVGLAGALAWSAGRLSSWAWAAPGVLVFLLQGVIELLRAGSGADLLRALRLPEVLVQWLAVPHYTRHHGLVLAGVFLGAAWATHRARQAGRAEVAEDLALVAATPVGAPPLPPRGRAAVPVLHPVTATALAWVATALYGRADLALQTASGSEAAFLAALALVLAAAALQAGAAACGAANSAAPAVAGALTVLLPAVLLLSGAADPPTGAGHSGSTATALTSAVFLVAAGLGAALARRDGRRAGRSTGPTLLTAAF